MDHGKVSSPGREKAKKSKVSGAVANRRQAGDPDTYQCTHCWRVIADNESAKEQHWDSLHCRTKRYQYSGYGDEKTCRKLAKADLAKQTQRWKLKENGSLRGSDPPPEPRGRPSWHRSPSFSKEKRSSREQRARSTGRGRSRGKEPSVARYAGRMVCGPYEVRRDGQIRNRSRRWDDGIEINKYGEVVSRESRVKRPERDRGKRSREPVRPEADKERDKKASRSVKDADRDSKKEARETESEEYSYTYDESSPADEDKAKKETCSQERKGPPRSAEKKKETVAQRSPPVAKAGAGAATSTHPAAELPQCLTQPALPAGNIERRQDLYNSLLRTAMEAVKKLE